jgi:uncharacterized protein (TIGR03084 family)
MGKLDEVLADLRAEGDQLEFLVAGLPDEQWRTPTPARGWDVAAQIAHLAWTDELAVLAATDKAGWEAAVSLANADPQAFVDDAAAGDASVAPCELLARWQRSRPLLAKTLQAYPGGQKLPWFGPPMSATSMATARFMETWAHSLDVHEALGAAPQKSDRVRHVVLLGVITRKFAFVTNNLPAPEEDVFVSLTLPSGVRWEHGSSEAANSVRGSGYDFALRATQRRHRDDLDLVATGDVADRWLDIAQAFAGPAGAGRPATERTAS